MTLGGGVIRSESNFPRVIFLTGNSRRKLEHHKTNGIFAKNLLFWNIGNLRIVQSISWELFRIPIHA